MKKLKYKYWGVHFVILSIYDILLYRNSLKEVDK